MDKDFGPYELRDRIGKGGMAWVYLAHQKNLDRPVALKILFPHLAEDEKLVARFQLEARSAAQMRHENVCQVYDFGRHGEQFYIAMEYVEGKNLRDWIDHNGTPPLEIALLMLRDVCRGLEHAHKRSIIHRDIKPSNVMFTPEGVIKLMDFGLARRAEDTTGITMVGSMLGTPAYMSPEQARGEKLDRPTTDIFSFGIVCYELLSGMRPFQGDTSSIARAILYAEPRPLDALDPLVPPDIEAMIRRMLEKDAGLRVQTVTEVRQAFDLAVASLGLAHDRSLLDEYAENPQAVGSRLRAQRLARHLENAREAEARGDAGALLREYRCVAFLDPANSTAVDYVREHGVAWPTAPAGDDLDHTIVLPPEQETVLLPPSTASRATSPPPEQTSVVPAPPPVPPLDETSVFPPGEYPPGPVPPAASRPGTAAPPRDRSSAARPPGPAVRPAARPVPGKQGGVPIGVFAAAGVGVALIAVLAILQPWRSREEAPEPVAPAPVTMADTLTGPVEPADAGPLPAALTVQTTPEDASVSIEGGAFQPAPARFPDLVARSYTVRVRRDSFQTARRTVVISGRDTTLRVTLRPSATGGARLALLVVRTVPPDASVELDGEQTSAAPARFRNLSSGEHTLDVSREGYEPRSLTFVARPGAESTLTVTLSVPRLIASPRTVTVRTIPAGGEVQLDDSGRRREPARFEAVRPGVHRLRARLRGLPVADQMFTLSGYRDTTISIALGGGALPGATATLVVWARPPSDFYVDRELKGSGLDSVRVTVPADREQLVHIRESSPWFGLTAQATVRPKPGEVKYVGRDFTLDGGRLDVSTPGRPGAEVVLDGRNTGRYTPATLYVKSGSHKIEVVSGGFRAREGEQSVRVRAGQSAAITFTLEPQ